MSRFTMDSFTDIFSESSKEITQQQGYIKIPLEKIKPNEKNFYSINDIDTLKHSIAITGLQSPLVVLPEDKDGYYTLLSGERRYTALLELVEEGRDDFSEISCSIIDPNDIDVPLSYDEKIDFLIVTTNAEQRDLTKEDILNQIKVLRNTYVSLKKQGEAVPKLSRTFIAQELGMSESQVHRYSTIEKHLLYSIFVMFCDDKIPLTVACDIAKMSRTLQSKFYALYKDETNITSNMVQEFLTAQSKSIATELPVSINNINSIKNIIKKVENKSKKKVLDENSQEEVDQLIDEITANLDKILNYYK